MAYSVHNFEQGDVLYANQLNEMDAQIALNEQNIDADVSSDMLAEEYSANKTYSIGDYVMYNNALYVCIYEITAPEGWNSTHWQTSNLGAGIKNLNGEVGSLNNAFDSFVDSVDEVIEGVDNSVSIDFSEYLLPESHGNATVTYTDVNFKIENNNINLNCLILFDTIAGHSYTCKYKYEVNEFSINPSIYNYYPSNPFVSGNKIANSVLSNNISTTTFVAESDKSAIAFTVRYNSATFYLYDCSIVDNSLTPSIDGEKIQNDSIVLEKIKQNDLYDFKSNIISDITTPTLRAQINLLDKTKIEDGIVTSNGGISTLTSGYKTSDYIPVKAGYKVFGASLNTNTWRDLIFRYAFYDRDKVYIPNSYGENSNYPGYQEIAKINAPVGAYFVRCSWNSVYNVERMYITTTDIVDSPFFGYAYQTYSDDKKIISDLDWYGTTLLTYGDSITAIGNGDDITRGWQFYVSNYYGIAENHNRGVGSQTFVFNQTMFEVDETTGNYISRGTASDNCLGAFCAWERIEKMIPASIKDDIDLIIIMGGTNDHMANSPLGTDIEWSASNDDDTDWANSSEFNGGDYDISNVKGAVASTIMKMQARCPNAKIVIATPISGRGAQENMLKNSLDLTIHDYASAIKEAAEYMSIPCIDVTGTCGINQMNYAGKITDGIHPYSFTGMRMLAAAIIGGLKDICICEE